jgi:hypothetical protein
MQATCLRYFWYGRCGKWSLGFEHPGLLPCGSPGIHHPGLSGQAHPRIWPPGGAVGAGARDLIPRVSSWDHAGTGSWGQTVPSSPFSWLDSPALFCCIRQLIRLRGKLGT